MTAVEPRKKTISATEARVHFGEVLRGVSEERATYYVERSGAPIAVVVPVEEYEAMLEKRKVASGRPDWLENALRIGDEWAAERNSNEPLDWDALIDEGHDQE